ncbi:MAG: biopolymer transporter ExbD [Bacteroidota bacterium]
MSKFKTKGKHATQVNTSALPDIVFLLLFFFMMSATIRPKPSPLAIQEPRAQALTQAERRELIRELQIGPRPGRTSSVIMADAKVLKVEEVASWVIEQRNTLPENLQPQMIVLIRADEYVDMGLISDVQQELRKSNARKVLYRALKGPQNSQMGD